MTPQYDPCEDCLGTGGQGRNCGPCGGTGHVPANAAARAIEDQRDEARRAAIWDRVWAEEDGYAD